MYTTGEKQEKYEKKEQGNTKVVEQSGIHKSLANGKTLQIFMSQKMHTKSNKVIQKCDANMKLKF